MSRRKAYSKLEKKNRVTSKFADGKGDKSFRGFQCLNSNCDEFIYVLNEEIKEDFEIECPQCGFSHYLGGETVFFDYQMVVEKDNNKEITSEGSFTVRHEEYLSEALEYKYCVICKTLKPIDFFDKHNSRKTKRQSECSLCKKIYNSIKNGTRLTDQHRESAQKRRLYIDISGNEKIDSDKIYKRFENKCFNCNKDLTNVETKLDKPLDHTLPVYYLWPLNTQNATLLCRECNSNKSGSWPSEFYTKEKLKKLSILTGIEYKLLSGEPKYNPEAVNFLKFSQNVNHLIEKYSAYIYEIIKLRNRILKDIDMDIFNGTNISEKWIEEADNLMRR
ncbi:hypothetical protein K2V56_01925 [Staphylococcus chromogenes]|uniref:hypothetical protein n=1 Tax=Staphylococcus chromogenes TaxID=46126 RepID=UPI001E46B51D|nr:hypothetical protein [Staphylococcus chromogenes]MCD8904222.1 hypothetical protein [Staphylococcus chromogenes]